MFLLTHRILRGMVLALMFFLVGTAYCSCDSYDPDPYDDIPPVVTVEFNYVLPSRVNVRQPNSQKKFRQQVSSTRRAGKTPAEMNAAFAREIAVILYQRPLQLVIPLRC